MEAEAAYRAALEVRMSSLPADHPSVAMSKTRLGSFYLDAGRLAEAAPLLEEALATRVEVLPESHPDRVDSLIKVGRLRAAQGRADEARALLAEAIDQGTRARGETDAQVRTAREILAQLEG